MKLAYRPSGAQRLLCDAVVAVVIGLGLAACGKSSRTTPPTSPPPPPPPVRLVKSIQTLKDPGGRVDWSHARNVIALDRAGTDGFYDVYTMNPDGSDERCLTCDKAALPNKHIGNPSWHPSGDWIAFQAQIRAPGNDDLATPGAGGRNNIWVMDSQGQRFFQFTDVDPRFGGVLHAQFSHRGDMLLWAERIANSADLYGLWALKLADFRVVNNSPRLENIRTLKPGQQKFYESHGFTRDDREIIFSGNLEQGQSELGIDIYRMDIATGAVTNLTNTPNNWDEHAQLSPGGGKILWMSSANSPAPVITDYWLMNLDGTGKERITFFNQAGHADFIPGGVTSGDSSWNADGTRIIAYLILSQGERSGRIVMMDLNSAVSDTPPVDDTIARIPGGAVVPPGTRGSDERRRAGGQGSPRSEPVAGTFSRVTVAPRSVSELRGWDGEVTRLERAQELVRIDSAPDPFVPGRSHERFVQVRHGVRIYGAELTRQTAAGQTVSMFGTLYYGADPAVAPAFSPAAVRAAIETRPGVRLRAGSEPQLVLLPLEDGRLALAYEAHLVSPADMLAAFIDARTGDLLDSFSDVQAQQPPAGGTDDRTRRPANSGAAAGPSGDAASGPPGLEPYTIDLGGSPEKALRLLTVTGSVPSSGRGDAAEPRSAAQVNAEVTRDVLLTRFKRAPAAGTRPTVSVTRALPPGDTVAREAYPLFARPAFYAGSGVVVYGEADVADAGTEGRDPASALDVVAHELAHAVIESSSRLIYRGESGALNEAFADIIGTAVEFAARPAGARPGRADYMIGEDVFGPAAWRSLQDPAAHHQADHFDRRFLGTADNRGVHVNAGIASHAFYLAVEGGTHAFSGVTVEGVGARRRADIERVFYRAFVFLLPADATFALARAATEQAARDLLPDDPAVLRAVSDAWTAVGVLPPASH